MSHALANIRARRQAAEKRLKDAKKKAAEAKKKASAAKKEAALATKKAAARKPKRHHSGMFTEGKRHGFFMLISAFEVKNVSMPLKRQWNVRCDCGKTLVVPEAYMRRKPNPKIHCGCMRPESLIMKYNREYHIWQMMHKRCDDITHISYEAYGGAGVDIWPEWRKTNEHGKGFDQFIADMGPAPNKDYSLDRINPYKSYSPMNCRWATDKEQANNKKENWLCARYPDEQRLYDPNTSLTDKWNEEGDYLDGYTIRVRDAG